MKTHLFTVLAAMSLSACNPDRGPEYTTPAEFGEVTVSPQTMAFDSEVRVKVSVSCPYGLRNVCILYMLDGDESDVRTVAKTEPPADVIIGMGYLQWFLLPFKYKKKYVNLSKAAIGKNINIPDPFYRKSMEFYKNTMDVIKTYLIVYAEKLEKEFSKKD